MSINGVNSSSGQTVYVFSREAPRGAMIERESPVSPCPDTLELSSDDEDTADAAARARLRAEERITFTAEELAPLKDRFLALQDAERNITTAIAALLSSLKIQPGVDDQLKIEIDANGKIIVGGLSDPTAAKRLRQAINNDGELLKQLVDFQKEEAELSRDLRSVTGMSLFDYKRRVADRQMRAGEGDLATALHGRDSSALLQDQDLAFVDAEFASLISRHYASTFHTADISGSDRLFARPDKTVNRIVREGMDEAAAAFYQFNMNLKERIDDPEIVRESLIRLRDLTVRVDADGGVTIEGRASEDDDSDTTAKEMIERIFEEWVGNNPATGRRSGYALAAQHLGLQYQDAFDPGDGATVETVFKNGRVESHLSNPETEALLREEIAVETRVVLAQWGIHGAENLDIVVSDTGRITVVDPPAGIDGRLLGQALDSLNRQTAERSAEDTREMDRATGAVSRIKGLLAHLDVFLPGGTETLQKSVA